MAIPILPEKDLRHREQNPGPGFGETSDPEGNCGLLIKFSEWRDHVQFRIWKTTRSIIPAGEHPGQWPRVPTSNHSPIFTGATNDVRIGPARAIVLDALSGVRSRPRAHQRQLWATAQVPPGGSGTWQAAGKNGAVAAGGAEAVDAGLGTLKSGGNAVDAAVATILALTVTDANSVCFGGEVPMMIYDAKTGAVEVLSGQGVAPELATRVFFEAHGGIPAKGLEPAAVPALLDACLTALDRHGTITFARAAAPMLRLLHRHEKDWHKDLERTVFRLIEAEKGSGGARRRGLRLVADVFLPWPAGAGDRRLVAREGRTAPLLRSGTAFHSRGRACCRHLPRLHCA